MKRLLIDDRLRDLAKEYKKEMAINFKVKPTKRLADLINQLDPVDYAKERDYIQHIIKNYESIILLEPDKFDEFHEKFFKEADVSKPVIKKVKDRKTKKTKNEEKKLHERIVECMRYKDVRTDIYPLLFPKLNLHTCPYCNAQYLDVVERKAGERGNFQLDHAYPKSKYPWLCTTFFNMVPSCCSCNLAKHADAPVYNFYTNDYSKLYPFHFRLETKSLLRYLLTQDEKKLEIKLNTTEAGLDNYEQAFSIESLYSAYNDVVEEIIWKAKIYNESFKANLEESLGRLFPYCGDFTRFVVGNYTDPKDILKRPLALLMGDIARQLKLI